MSVLLGDKGLSPREVLRAGEGGRHATSGGNGHCAFRFLFSIRAMVWLKSLQYSIKGPIFKFSTGPVSQDVHGETIHFS